MSDDGTYHGCPHCTCVDPNTAVREEYDRWNANGPFTFEAFYNLCKMIVAIDEEVRDFQIGDSLDEFLPKFSVGELCKLRDNYEFCGRQKIINSALDMCDDLYGDDFPVWDLTTEQVTVFQDCLDVQQWVHSSSWNKFLRIHTEERIYD